MANLEHFEMFGGENRTLTLHARDFTNTAVNLTGSTLAWYLGAPPQDPDMRAAFITKTGTILSAPAGTFTVALMPTDTQDLHGEYLHQAVATDGSGNESVVSMGRLRLRRLMDAS